jgi:hypothetical protein
MTIIKTSLGFESEDGRHFTGFRKPEYLERSAERANEKAQFYSEVISTIKAEKEAADLIPLAKNLRDAFFLGSNWRPEWEALNELNKQTWLRVARVAKEFADAQ